VTAENARLGLLRAELARDWDAVRAHLSNALSVDPAASAPCAAYVALSLDHACQAFENVLLRLERGLGLPERQGDAWHRALLADGAMAIAGVRPAVFPAEVEGDWEELLRFRHFLRHAYVATLDPVRLAANTARLARATQATEPFVQALVAALLP